MLQRTAGEVTNIADLENCWDGGKPSLINLGDDTAETVRPSENGPRHEVSGTTPVRELPKGRLFLG